MFGGSIPNKFGSWRLAGHPQVVEYAIPVLDDIVADVVSGFRKFPHGGLGVGGVLFGEGEKHLVRILATRPMPCDHTAGPTFTLSDADHQALDRLLAEAGNDPDLAGLKPVGWYHSHTRSGLHFTPSDLDVHERHFPEPWQIAVVLRPDLDRPTAAGIFTRGEGGAVPTPPALLLEDVRSANNDAVMAGVMSEGPGSVEEAARRAEATETVPENSGGLVIDMPAFADTAEEVPVIEESPEPIAETAPPATPPAAHEPAGGAASIPSFGSYDKESSGAGIRRKVLAGAGAILVLAVVLVVAFQYLVPAQYWDAVNHYGAQAGTYLASVADYWRGFAARTRQPSLELRALAADDRLLIRWDATSDTLVGVTSGVLEIDDGGHPVRRDLETSDINQGSFYYRRTSGDVRVRLTLARDGGDPLSESTRFIGIAPPATGTAEPATDGKSTEEIRAELEGLRTDLLRQQDQTRGLQSTLEALRQIGIPPAETARTPAPRPKPTPTLEQKPPDRTESEVAVQPPAEPPSRPAPLPPPVKPAPAVPSSGRILWTGYLPAGQTLTFDGGRPSTGSVSGRFPGVPVRVSVYPGELTGGGLTVYSDQPNQAGVTEAPGPQNSWNQTTFRYSAEQAAALSVTERPAAGNGWDRLVVSSSGRPLSVVVISWQRTGE